MKGYRITLLSTLIGLIAAFGFRPDPGVESAINDWPAYAGDAQSSQFSSLTQIRPDNINDIEPVWSLPLGDETSRANPLVIDGVLYTVTDKALYSVNARTGEQKWRTEVDRLSRPRGIVYWRSERDSQSRILYLSGNQLLALYAESGQPVEGFEIDLRQGFGRPPEEVRYGGNMTPGRIYRDLLIIGAATGEQWGSPPGNIRAFDLNTGELRWVFNTVPQPGEYGYESNPPTGWKTIGGNNNWGEMTLDVDNGIVFVPLGSPTYDFWGVDRPGNNLFGNSLLALDAQTGRRLWHFQTVHHDLWDYDLVTAPKLLTLTHNGKPVQAVAQATKTGYIYTFERKSGRPLFPIIEQDVPQSDIPGEGASPTQPIPVAPPPFAVQRFTIDDINPNLPETQRQELIEQLKSYRNEGLFTPPSLQGTIMMPGHAGGAQFGNVAVDAERGRLYVVGINIPTLVKLEPPADVAQQLQDFSERLARASRTNGVFLEHCAACHGEDRKGKSPVFPPLLEIASRLTLSEFTALLQTGRGMMPAFDLPPRDFTKLAAFLGFDIPSGWQPPHMNSESASGKNENKNKKDEVAFKSFYHYLMTDESIGKNAAPWSTLTAYDMNEGTLLWQVPFGNNAGRGALGDEMVGDMQPKGTLVATAGGLLLSSNQGGWLSAWDADTGELILRRKLPAEAVGIPAVYGVDGRQFITVPVAAPATMTEQLAGQGDNRPESSLIAFSLPEQVSE